MLGLLVLACVAVAQDADLADSVKAAADEAAAKKAAAAAAEEAQGAAMTPGAPDNALELDGTFQGIAEQDPTTPPQVLEEGKDVDGSPRFNPTGQTAWAESSANYDGVRHRRPIGIDLYELMGANPFGWAGVAAVGEELFFAPSTADHILTLDVTVPEKPRANIISTRAAMPSVLPTGGFPTYPQGPMKWCGVTAVGSHAVVFEPQLATAALVLRTDVWNKDRRDPDLVESYLRSYPVDKSVTTGGTKRVPMFGTQKWIGAAAVGETAVLGPSFTGEVPTMTVSGRVQPILSSISAKGLAGYSATNFQVAGGEALWQGAVTYGSKVYYAPHNSGEILVLDMDPYKNASRAEISKRSWRTGIYSGSPNSYAIPTSGLLDGSGGSAEIDDEGVGSHEAKWSGGAACTKGPCDGRVYFAPFGSDNILVLNTTAETIRTIAVPYFSGRAGKWRGCAFKSPFVYCSPYNADGILVLDTRDETVHIVGTRLISNRTAKWIGAAAVGDRIYFAPYAARRVLVYDTLPVDPNADAAAPPVEEDSLLQQGRGSAADAGAPGQLRRVTEAP